MYQTPEDIRKVKKRGGWGRVNKVKHKLCVQ